MSDYNAKFFRFLNLIGSVFSFVSSDVKSKIKIMEKHREGENAIQYDSFKKMMKYEKESGLCEKHDFVSGSRTMLRLHRGLGMFYLLFRKKLACKPHYNHCRYQYNGAQRFLYSVFVVYCVLSI